MRIAIFVQNWLFKIQVSDSLAQRAFELLLLLLLLNALKVLENSYHFRYEIQRNMNFFFLRIFISVTCLKEHVEISKEKSIVLG